MLQLNNAYGTPIPLYLWERLINLFLLIYKDESLDFWQLGKSEDLNCDSFAK